MFSPQEETEGLRKEEGLWDDAESAASRRINGSFVQRKKKNESNVVMMISEPQGISPGAYVVEEARSFFEMTLDFTCGIYRSSGTKMLA